MFSVFMKKVFVLTLVVLIGVSAIEAGAALVYVMDAGNAGENTRVTNVLTGFGHTVTIGSVYSSFDGSASLSGYDVVLLMPNYSWSADMPTPGQTALRNYVNGGGGLVTSEWTIWGVGTGRFATLAPAIPATYSGAYTSAPSTMYFKGEADPVINYSLSGPSYLFSLTNLGGTESKIAAQDRAHVFYTSSYGGTVNTSYAGLVGWDYGGGRVISFSTLIAENELANAYYRQLFNNAVNYAAQVPLPGAMLLLASGLVWRGRDVVSLLTNNPVGEK